MKKEKIVEEGYRKAAKEYHKRRLKESNSLSLLNSAVKKMPKKGKVLDVGCGAGYPVTKFFADKGYSVVGVDISSEMLKIARKTIPNAKFYKKDMSKLDFANRSFNIIVSFFAIIHVPREKHKKIISKFYKMLKPKGVILICMGIGDEEEHINPRWHGTKMYWSHFDKKTNLKLVREVGFKIIWNKNLGPKNDRHNWILAKRLR